MDEAIEDLSPKVSSHEESQVDKQRSDNGKTVVQPQAIHCERQLSMPTAKSEARGSTCTGTSACVDTLHTDIQVVRQDQGQLCSTVSAEYRHPPPPPLPWSGIHVIPCTP